MRFVAKVAGIFSVSKATADDYTCLSLEIWVGTSTSGLQYHFPRFFNFHANVSLQSRKVLIRLKSLRGLFHIMLEDHVFSKTFFRWCPT